MLYFISFLEGIITFISPCMLPMLPIYISYFAGNGGEGKKTVVNALGFVAGFTIIFLLMGAFAGSIGSLLKKYRQILDIITGLIVIFFGLTFMDVIKINLFGGMKQSISNEKLGFFSALIFGIVFSVGWTPCVGAFLGSALMMASNRADAFAGICMLFVYSMGLGIPFIISAVLVDKLKSTFDFIKKHYRIINKICGIFLIVIGILMITGLMGKYFAIAM